MRSVLNRLQHPETEFGERIHVVAASSMMSHGVDIDRLNTMVMLGVPLTAAEFIQATARIGRMWPGLVVVLHKMALERDASVFRSFTPFVEQGDRFVEAIPITRKSRRVLERTLPGLVMARLRHLHEPASDHPLTVIQRVRQFFSERGIDAGTELAAISDMLGLDPRLDERLCDEAGRLLQAFFRSINDPAVSETFPDRLFPTGIMAPIERCRGTGTRTRLSHKELAMREFRSGSQILFGYLPEQTVDLAGRVWKVRNWGQAVPVALDDTTLRSEVVRQAAAWERTGNDGEYVRDLRRGLPLSVVTLNFDAGVHVEDYPRVWLCKSCNRVELSDERACRCGSRRWGQFHFVGYHDCGFLREPWITRCPQHGEVRIRFPGTASAAEISLECPVCGVSLRRGLGAPNCPCGRGHVTFTVHRAARVYTPRSVVIINPPTPARMRELHDAGGAMRALHWVVNGMQTTTAAEIGRTRHVFVRQLISQGFDPDSAESVASRAVELGQVTDEAESVVDVPEPYLGEAEDQAVKIALATLESRVQRGDLERSTAPGSELRSLYAEAYPAALAASGLEAVELIDRFPVLVGNFGYTRGDVAPGATAPRGVPRPDWSLRDLFRRGSDRGPVHPAPADTSRKMVEPPGPQDRPMVRRAIRGVSILRAATLPAPGADPPPIQTVGSAILTLVHSYCHRLIRRASVLAGLEKNSLSEFLVPLHLGFFVFASARGGFVLGGLQALFENDLHRVLEEVAFSEHRCALDPGCGHAGASCAACLHLGEPSCRWFNRYLDRRALHGPDGFLNFPES